jgi:hypothetical protein
MLVHVACTLLMFGLQRLPASSSSILIRLYWWRQTLLLQLALQMWLQQTHDELAFGMAGRHMHTPSLQSRNVQAAHSSGGLVVAVVHKHAVWQHMRVNWWQQVLVEALAHALSASICEPCVPMMSMSLPNLTPNCNLHDAPTCC